MKKLSLSTLLVLMSIFIMTWVTKNSEQQISPVNSPSILPIVGNFDISSSFGERIGKPEFRQILGIKPKFNRGIDFKATTGTPVLATSSGKIVRVQHIRTGYGNNIVIEHDAIYKSLYAQLSEINVEVGQSVKKGEVIGKVGNSGASIASHLHFEVIENGKKVNPENFLSLRAE